MDVAMIIQTSTTVRCGAKNCGHVLWETREFSLTSDVLNFT